MSATERGRWLAELALAVEDAQQLALSLGGSKARCREAGELHAQLEAIRIEVEMLRRGRSAGPTPETDPYWTNFLGWMDVGSERAR